MKLQKGEATAEPSQPPAPVAAPVPVPSEVMEVDHGDDTVKERSRSITEQLSTVRCALVQGGRHMNVNVICAFFFFFFLCVPQLYLWGSPLWGEIFAYVTVS